MKKLSLLLLAIAVVFIFVGGSCGQKIAEKATEKAIEKATNTDIEVTNSSFTMNVNGSSYSTQEGQIPEGYPRDIKYYPGQVTNGSKISTAEGTSYTIAISTSDSTSTIMQYYKDNFSASDGWQTLSEYTGPTGAILSMQKGTMSLSMVIYSDTENTSNSIAHTLLVK